jgi:hypothetical protein
MVAIPLAPIPKEKKQKNKENMPTLCCNRDDLFVAIGKEYTDESFDELCFEL